MEKLYEHILDTTSRNKGSEYKSCFNLEVVVENYVVHAVLINKYFPSSIWKPMILSPRLRKLTGLGTAVWILWFTLKVAWPVTFTENGMVSNWNILLYANTMTIKVFRSSSIASVLLEYGVPENSMAPQTGISYGYGDVGCYFGPCSILAIHPYAPSNRRWSASHNDGDHFQTLLMIKEYNYQVPCIINYLIWIMCLCKQEHGFSVFLRVCNLEY